MVGKEGAAARGWVVGRAAKWGRERLLLTLNSPAPFSHPAPTQVPVATNISAAHSL